MVSFNKLTRTLAGIAAAALITFRWPPVVASAMVALPPPKVSRPRRHRRWYSESPCGPVPLSSIQAKNVVEVFNEDHKNQVDLKIIPNDDMEGKVVQHFADRLPA